MSAPRTDGRSESDRDNTPRRREQNLTSCLGVGRNAHICLTGSILSREKKKKKADIGGTLRSHTRPSGKLINRLYFVVLLRLVKTRGCLFWPARPGSSLQEPRDRAGPKRPPSGGAGHHSSSDEEGRQTQTPDASAIKTQGKGRRWLRRRCRRVSGMPHMLKTLPAVQLGFFLPSMEIERPRKASLSEAVFRLQKGKDAIRWKRPGGAAHLFMLHVREVQQPKS